MDQIPTIKRMSSIPRCWPKKKALFPGKNINTTTKPDFHTRMKQELFQWLSMKITNFPTLHNQTHRPHYSSEKKRVIISRTRSAVYFPHKWVYLDPYKREDIGKKN